MPVAEFYGKGQPRINYLANLSREHSLPVRRRFVDALARWMREMDGADLYEQEVRLAPYLLSALFDADAEIRRRALAHLEALGGAYLSLHEADFKEKIEYGHLNEAAADAALGLPLREPFTGRPSFGARARMRQHFRALIYPIMAELQSWTSVERMQSALLLEVPLVFQEFPHQVLPALAKASGADVSAELAAQAGHCAALSAQHVSVEQHPPLGLPQLQQDALDPPGQRSQYYALLTAHLSGVRRPLAALVPFRPLGREAGEVVDARLPP